MANSTYNLQPINSVELLENLKATIDFGGNIFVAGRRGSSKTSQARDAIRAMGLKEVYLNLSLFERVDMGGFPNFFRQGGNGFLEYLMPYFFKDLMEGDVPCVVILDEVDKCSSDILAPLLEFTQFRTMNGKKLKNLVACIMTGNLVSEGGQRPPLPLLDRTEKFLVEMNYLHWLEWGAQSRQIHPSVSAFISQHTDELFGAEVDPGELYSDPSPRGWHNASSLLFFGEYKKWRPELIKKKVAACVGQRTGVKYNSFFQYYQELTPAVINIMENGKEPQFGKFEKTKQLIVAMSVCQRFSSLIDNIKNAPLAAGAKFAPFKMNPNEAKTSINVANFLSNIDPEMSTVVMRSQIGGIRFASAGLFKDPSWNNVLEQFLGKVGKKQEDFQAK